MSISTNSFLRPKNIQVQQMSRYSSRIILEPFERGFGYTLGNALRRVLLSSMSGSAITEVKIEGVLHEYSSIEGVQEDVINILLNLKGVSILMEDREEATLVLSKQGPGFLTAGDIQVSHQIQVLNPEHILAHLGENAKINMQIKVEKGQIGRASCRERV